MNTFVGLSSLQPSPDGTALAIGTFDGVHVGHRALIGKAIERARSEGMEAGVLTWDRHPNETLRPERVPPMLSSPERRAELLGELGVDKLVVLPFDEALSHLPAEDFARDVLGKGLRVDAVFVGHGWRFGHKARGDVALLRTIGDELGFSVEEVGLIEVAGGPASSSRAREAVGRGDMALARTLLSRPFDLDGVVEHGDDRGKGLGFPTANLSPDPRLARPPRGVYAGRARVQDIWYAAAINVGVNPTFGGEEGETPIRVEAYLLDLDADLYGRTLRIEFWERLRDEIAFESVDALVAQMKRDVETTRSLVLPLTG